MLHHVEIYVADLEESRLFWSGLLEELSYELYQTWNEGFSYKFADTYLVFVQNRGTVCRGRLSSQTSWAQSFGISWWHKRTGG